MTSSAFAQQVAGALFPYHVKEFPCPARRSRTSPCLLLAAPLLVLLVLSFFVFDVQSIHAQASEPVSFTQSRFGSGLRNIFAVAIGDVDNDVDFDIVALETDEDEKGCYFVAVYANDGDGNFAPNETSHNTLCNEKSTAGFALADMNEDQKLDLILGSQDGQSDVYFNDGSGHFDERNPGSTEFLNVNGRTVGYLDKDRSLDSVVDNRIYLGSDSGNKSQATIVRPYVELDGSGRNYVSAVVLADMDMDSDLDIVASIRSRSARQPSTAIYLNDGNADFGTKLKFGVEGVATSSLAVGDMNGDGRLDIVTGNWFKQGIVYLNDTLMDFGNASAFTPDFPLRDNIWELGMLNKDDLVDIVTVYGDLCFAKDLCTPDAMGHLTTGTRVLPDGEKFVAVALGDLDGDSYVDIVGGGSRENQIYLNDGNGHFDKSKSFGPMATKDENFKDFEIGDMDGDGDPDIVDCTYDSQCATYLNDGSGNFGDPVVFGPTPTRTNKIKLGDMNGDGSLDIVAMNLGSPGTIYLNDGTADFKNTWAFEYVLSHLGSMELADIDVDGDVDIITGDSNEGNQNQIYLNGGDGNFRVRAFAKGIRAHGSIEVRDGNSDGNIDIILGPTMDGKKSQIFYNATERPGITALRGDGLPNSGRFVPSKIISDTVINIPYIITDKSARPVGKVRGCYSLNGGGKWQLAVEPNKDLKPADKIVQPIHGCPFVPAWEQEITPPKSTSLAGETYSFPWDTFASGFFGNSDNVVFRIEIFPYWEPLSRSTLSPHLYPSNAAVTYPFRMRGSQVQVVDLAGHPVSDAIVYRIPAGQAAGGSAIGTSKKEFRTNMLGYLQGRGELGTGDQLLALDPVTPVTITERFSTTVHLYYTNGAITANGVSALITNTQSTTVTQPGVQVLQVSSEQPLLLFDVDVALEWDASKEPRYLDQLAADLKEASRYLYDFTDGQVALGRVRVSQNGDNWGSAHIVVHATNRLRPYAAIGGAVVTDTADFNPDLDITYTPGQIHIGSVWNRYGDINPNPGIDWPLILAHELGHYLLGLEDTYLGIDTPRDIGGPVLVNVDTCPSAMGDVYEPDNTEFIYDDNVWGDKCAKTLSNMELNRNEWSTIKVWFPELITPTEVISGPNTQPFDFTTIVITDPVTATTVLANQAFYLDYGDRTSTLSRSSDARVFLLRGEDGNGAPDFIYDLGNAIGDQNLVRAHGVQSGDKICVFDRPRQHAGCPTVTEDQDHIRLQEQADWLPVVEVSLVNSVTFSIRVTNVAAETLSGLKARVYPEYGSEAEVADLVPDGNAYSGTLTVTTPALTGHVYVWSSKSQHQAIVAYSIGGNPGNPRSAGGAVTRAGIGNPRSAGGGDIHPGDAPAISPDGKLIFFATSPITLTEGQFYTVQDMASLPALPLGRKVIGQGYSLAATGFPKDANPLPGSVSIQYNAFDVLTEGADEDQLGIYFWNSQASQECQEWKPLKTHRSPYYNLVSAQSQGPGVYALLTGIIAPEVKGVYPLSGTTDITTSITVTGANFLTSTSVMLVDISNMKNTYVLATTPISSTELTAVVKSEISPAMYLVIAVNHNQPGEEVASSSAVHFEVCERKRVCVQR